MDLINKQARAHSKINRHKIYISTTKKMKNTHIKVR